MSNITYPKYKLPDDLSVNSVTASNILVENDITINGTASINVINTIESNKVVVGDKYIVLASGSNSQNDLNGAGILFGSGSSETPTGDQQSVAHILYRNDGGDGRIDIFPGLNVSGSISTTSITASLYTGSFKGDGSQLTNIPASAVDLTNYARKDLSNTFTAKQTISSSLQIGSGTIASGDYSHAEGRGTISAKSGSHSEGLYAQSWGNYSHAEGISSLTNGQGAHSEGYYSQASGNYSHAEGNGVFSYGEASHAEGFGTKASGACSHAEGSETFALGICSHAEGRYTLASSSYSHAEGLMTTASISYQHVEGKYNATSSTALALVGNGTSNIARSNILEIYQNNITISGSLNVSSSISASSLTGALFGTASYSQDSAKLGNVTSSLYALKTDVTGAIANFSTRSEVSGAITGALAPYATLTGVSSSFTTPTQVSGAITGALSNYITGAVTSGNITGSGIVDDPITLKDDISLNSVTASYNGGFFTNGILINGDGVIASNYSHGQGLNTTAIGNYSHAEGVDSEANGNYSHAEGASRAHGNYSHAEGYGCDAFGDHSHAEGFATITNAQHSHTQGVWTVTDGLNSHAEGNYTYTSTNAQSSHAEGSHTTASADTSHAEGSGSITYGIASHAEGYYTITSASYQHAQGIYNQTSSTALMLIGNGTSEIIRSNILEVYTGSVNILGQSVLDGGQVVKISNKTSNYSLTASSDYIITFNGTNLTGTLPSASLCNGSTFIIKNKHSSPLYITSSGGNIDGNGAVTISLQYHSYTLVSDGIDWNII